MVSSFIGTVSGLFDKRFLVTAWLPVFCFGAAGIILLALVIGPGAAIEIWDSWSPIKQLWASAGALVSVTLVAYVCNNFTYVLVHFYEGYWPVWMKRVQRWCVRRQARRWTQLHQKMNRLTTQKYNLEVRHASSLSPEQLKAVGVVQGEYDRLYAESETFFPQTESRLMPTRLGNVLRAAEDYSAHVYRLDAVLIWPRLVPHLPAAYQERLAQASTPMVATLFCATLSGLFALIGGGWLLFGGVHRPLLFVAVVGGGLVFARVFYETAVQSAVEYGVLIRTAFDLYRHYLLKALDLPVPKSPLREHVLWPQLTNWWYSRAIPQDGENGQPAWLGEQKEKKSSPSRPQEHIVHLKLETEPQEEDA
jgi:hypothetical protein